MVTVVDTIPTITAAITTTAIITVGDSMATMAGTATGTTAAEGGISPSNPIVDGKAVKAVKSIVQIPLEHYWTRISYLPLLACSKDIPEVRRVGTAVKGTAIRAETARTTTAEETITAMAKEDRAVTKVDIKANARVPTMVDEEVETDIIRTRVDTIKAARVVIAQ